MSNKRVDQTATLWVIIAIAVLLELIIKIIIEKVF